MLPGRLAGRVRASRPERVAFSGATLRDVAVDLVCADQQEHLVTMLASRLAQHRGASDIGLDEGERIHQGAVDVRRGREVDDGGDLGGELVDELRVADVAAYEAVAGLTFEL